MADWLSDVLATAQARSPWNDGGYDPSNPIGRGGVGDPNKRAPVDTYPDAPGGRIPIGFLDPNKPPPSSANPPPFNNNGGTPGAKNPPGAPPPPPSAGKEPPGTAPPPAGAKEPPPGGVQDANFAKGQIAPSLTPGGGQFNPQSWGPYPTPNFGNYNAGGSPKLANPSAPGASFNGGIFSPYLPWATGVGAVQNPPTAPGATTSLPAASTTTPPATTQQWPPPASSTGGSATPQWSLPQVPAPTAQPAPNPPNAPSGTPVTPGAKEAPGAPAAPDWRTVGVNNPYNGPTTALLTGDDNPLQDWNESGSTLLHNASLGFGEMNNAMRQLRRDLDPNSRVNQVRAARGMAPVYADPRSRSSDLAQQMAGLGMGINDIYTERAVPFMAGRGQDFGLGYTDRMGAMPTDAAARFQSAFGFNPGAGIGPLSRAQSADPNTWLALQGAFTDPSRTRRPGISAGPKGMM